MFYEALHIMMEGEVEIRLGNGNKKQIIEPLISEFSKHYPDVEQQYINNRLTKVAT